jgi:hypothetical protein
MAGSKQSAYVVGITHSVKVQTVRQTVCICGIGAGGLTKGWVCGVVEKAKVKYYVINMFSSFF